MTLSHMEWCINKLVSYPLKNSTAVRKYRHIIETATCLYPFKIWSEVGIKDGYLINRMSSFSQNDNIPHSSSFPIEPFVHVSHCVLGSLNPSSLFLLALSANRMTSSSLNDKISIPCYSLLNPSSLSLLVSFVLHALSTISLQVFIICLKRVFLGY